MKRQKKSLTARLLCKAKHRASVNSPFTASCQNTAVQNLIQPTQKASRQPRCSGTAESRLTELHTDRPQGRKRIAHVDGLH